VKCRYDDVHHKKNDRMNIVLKGCRRINFKELQMKVIELKNSTVSLSKEGILHIQIKSGADMQLNDAIRIVEAMGTIGGGKKFPVLIDCGDYVNIDKEVRIFSASPEGNIYTLAEAVAYASFAHKLVADFYVKHNRPSVPTKVFPNKTEATEWLKTFLKI
jgi:hypothetical protein